MKLKSTILIPFIILFACSLAQAQDYVKLKDGSFVRGTIVESFPGQYVRIKTEEGKFFQFEASELSKQGLGRRTKVLDIKPKGFFNNTSVGLFIGGSSYMGVSPSLQMVNGYQFGGRFSAGFGLGFEGIDRRRIMPLFADFRAYLRESGFSPYVSVTGGYTLQLSQDDYYWCDWGCYGNSESKNKGGLMGGISLGFRKYTSSHFGINFSTGYRYQSLVSDTQGYFWNAENNLVYYPVKEETRSHRMEVRFGIYFN